MVAEGEKTPAPSSVKKAKTVVRADHKLLALKPLFELISRAELRELSLAPEDYHFQSEEALTAAYDDISSEIAKYELRRLYNWSEEQIQSEIALFEASHAEPDDTVENVAPQQQADETAHTGEKDKRQVELVKLASSFLTEEERVDERQRWAESKTCATPTDVQSSMNL